MLGNYLKEKADSVSGTNYFSGDTTADTEREGNSLSDIARGAPNLRSGCLDIGYIINAGSTPDIIDAEMERLFASGYNSITVTLLTSDGTLNYLSDAAIKLSRISATDNLPKLEDIITLTDRIGKRYCKNPKVTAVFYLTSYYIDDPILAEATLSMEMALITEACMLGVDEVLLIGIPSSNGVIDDEAALLEFLDKLDGLCGSLHIGVALPASVYANNDMSKTLASVAKLTGFMAVDTEDIMWTQPIDEKQEASSNGTKTNPVTADADKSGNVTLQTSIYDLIYTSASSIKGSISLYGLRYLISGTSLDEQNDAIDALFACGVYGYHVITPPDRSVYKDGSEDEGDTADISEPTKDKDSETTKPKDKDTDKPKETTSAPPETTAPDTIETTQVEEMTTEPTPEETTGPVDTETETTDQEESDTTAETDSTADTDSTNEETELLSSDNLE
jgi:hypothetical protein